MLMFGKVNPYHMKNINMDKHSIAFYHIINIILGIYTSLYVYDIENGEIKVSGNP